MSTSRGKLYSAFGETHTLYEWSKITGINESTLRGRINKGLSVEDALTYKKYFYRGRKYKTDIGRDNQVLTYNHKFGSRSYYKDVEYNESVNEVKKGLGIKYELGYE